MSLSFNFVDFLIVLVILVSAGYAAWRGFLSETLSIMSWVAAAFGCLYFGPYLIPLVRGLVSAPWVASVLAYAAVFLAVFIPFSFMSHRFSETVKHSPIGPLDRALGIAFGVVRGLVAVGLAYIAFTYFVPIRQQPNWMAQARLLPVVQTTSDILLSLVPNQAHQDFTVTAPQAPVRHDPVADMIRRQDAPAAPVAQHRPATPAKTDKTYGASDRRALDRLIETSGNGGNRKP
jgi:membrane protein required for colicin V production